MPLSTVAQVDLARYAGTWYEIARFPNWFEEGCAGVTAEYSLRPDGAVGVRNTCRDGGLDGPVKTIDGVARAVDATNARLKVKFSPLMPVAGDYQVLWLDEGYEVAVVGTPSGSTGWILAREPQVSQAALAPALAALERNGYDTARLEFVDQPGG